MNIYHSMNILPFESKFQDDPFASSFPSRDPTDKQNINFNSFNNSNINQESLNQPQLRRTKLIQFQFKPNKRVKHFLHDQINDQRNFEETPNKEMQNINNIPFIQAQTKFNLPKERTSSIIIKTKGNEPIILNEVLCLFEKYGQIISIETQRENQIKIVYSNPVL